MTRSAVVEETRRILVVASTRSERDHVARALAAEGTTVGTERGMYEAVARLAQEPCRLLVVSLDGLVPSDRGSLRVLRRLAPGLRVLLLVPEGRRADALEFLDAGGDSLLPSPCDAREVALVGRSLLRPDGMDPLTGLPNRSAGDRALAREIARSHRSPGAPQGLAFVLLDLDRFKELNDVCGYRMADDVLRAVAARLRESFPRVTDVLARWGGDEFVAVLSMLPPDLEGARRAASAKVERVLADLGAMPLPAGAREAGAGPLTFSAGIAFFPWEEESPGRLFDLANRRVKRAKRRRGCVVWTGAARRGTGAGGPAAGARGPEARRTRREGGEVTTPL